MAADIALAVTAMGLPGCGSSYGPCNPDAGSPGPGRVCECDDAGRCDYAYEPADAGVADAGPKDAATADAGAKDAGGD